MPFPTASPSLEQLKRQAKDLLRLLRAAEPRARERLAAQLPSLAARALDDRGAVRLSHAQLVIARENGFASWPRLKAAVLAANAQHALVEATQTKAGTAPISPRSELLDRGAREAALHALAGELADLAAHNDAPGLAARCSRLPRRDILAVRALIVARGEHALLVDALLVGLKDASPRVRHDCAHALDHFADERCAEPLRQLLGDPVPRVRRMALHVLSCEACKLVPLPAQDDDLFALVLDRALADPSINVRRHATAALGGCRRDAQAEQALATLAIQESDAAIRREARRALRRNGVGS